MTDANYATETPLQIRIDTHKKYTVPDLDFADWVLDRIAWRDGLTVLDVGCGSGMYAPRVRARGGRYLAGDLSEGMLRSDGLADVPRAQLDVTRLPVRTASVDVVLANHMLYHVEDRASALREVHRALRPGGRLIAATNDSASMVELTRMPDRAVRELGHEPTRHDEPLDISWFDLESGEAVIRPVFPDVRRDVFDAALVFPDPAPALRYVESCRSWLEERLPEAVTWDAVLAQIATIIRRESDADGTYRVSKRSGAFVASKA